MNDLISFQAAVVCGCIGVIAEVSYEALKKRYDQGWVCEMIEDVEELMRRIREAKKKREVLLNSNNISMYMSLHYINLETTKITMIMIMLLYEEYAQRDEYDA